MPNPLFVEITPGRSGWHVRMAGHSATTVYDDLGAALDEATRAAGPALVRIVVRAAAAAETVLLPYAA
ncbi:MAG: hypothetical protein ACRDG3_00195 [Tepidiformaceae bacterium]